MYHPCIQHDGLVHNINHQSNRTWVLFIYFGQKPMPAYVIVEVNIHDPVAYEGYKLLTPAAVLAYGGRFVVRGASSESLEGDWNPQRMVVLEFPSIEKAKQWWHSPEYAEAKSIRQKAATTKMLVVEGYTGG